MISDFGNNLNIKKAELQKFFDEVNLLATTHNFKVYWKDSINNKLK